MCAGAANTPGQAGDSRLSRCPGDAQRMRTCTPSTPRKAALPMLPNPVCWAESLRSEGWQFRAHWEFSERWLFHPGCPEVKPSREPGRSTGPGALGAPERGQKAQAGGPLHVPVRNLLLQVEHLFPPTAGALSTRPSTSFKQMEGQEEGDRCCKASGRTELPNEKAPSTSSCWERPFSAAAATPTAPGNLSSRVLRVIHSHLTWLGAFFFFLHMREFGLSSVMSV